MRSLFFITIGTVLCSISSDGFAENEIGPAVEIGVKVASGWSTWSEATSSAQPGSEPGGAIGAFISVEVSPWIALQSELLYAAKGAHLAAGGQIFGTYTLRYLEVPVLAKLQLPQVAMLEPYAVGGPAFGRAITSYLETATNRDDIAEVIQRWEVGLALGAGGTVNLWRQTGLSVELRYTHGLTDIFDRPGYNVRKNRTVFLSLGVAWTRNKDSDRDGIPNHLDRCWNQPEDFDGFQDSDGCPDPDNDGDGIPDVDDKCPDEPEDFDGFQDADGCPDPDNDGDGILDVDDRCPDVPFPYTEDGCPPTYELIEIAKTRITLEQPVLFERGKADILAGNTRVLDEIARALTQHYPALRVRIEGHADGEGSASQNELLSQRRADTVRDYLIAQGVAPDRLVGKGYGETQPLHHEDTQEAKEKNRRVDFVILAAP